MRFLIILTFLFITSPTLATRKSGWKKVKQKDNITVWIKDSSEIDAQAFLAKTVIDACEDELLDILLDTERFPDWLERCKEVNVIERNDSTQTVYMRIGIPWPFQDRDMVQELKLSSSTEGSMIDMINQPEILEKKKGLVRLQNTGGQWQLKKVNGGTEITFTFWLDPGGFIPSMLSNIFLVNGPYRNLLNLGERVKLMRSVNDPVPTYLP